MMLAVLPRQNADDLTGELFVEVYQRQLAHLPNAAMTYLLDQSTRTCRWFPTVAECLEIASGWRRSDADTLRQTKARQRYWDEVNARKAPEPTLEPWKPTLAELEEVKRNIAKAFPSQREPE